MAHRIESEGRDMAHTATWDDLDRAEQKALARLYGGGSLLRINSDLVLPLARRGLVNREGITAAGDRLCAAQVEAFKERVYEQTRHR
jgi:hypothetical protein